MVPGSITHLSQRQLQMVQTGSFLYVVVPCGVYVYGLHDLQERAMPVLLHTIRTATTRPAKIITAHHRTLEYVYDAVLFRCEFVVPTVHTVVPVVELQNNHHAPVSTWAATDTKHIIRGDHNLYLDLYQLKFFDTWQAWHPDVDYRKGYKSALAMEEQRRQHATRVLCVVFAVSIVLLLVVVLYVRRSKLDCERRCQLR